MAKIRQGYRAVRCDLDSEENQAVLSFMRADGKEVVVTLTAEQVVGLSNGLASMIDTPTTPDSDEEIDNGTQEG